MMHRHKIRVWHLACGGVSPERRERQIEIAREVLGWEDAGEYDEPLRETLAEIVDAVNAA
jgi:hypothetical protein